MEVKPTRKTRDIFICLIALFIVRDWVVWVVVLRWFERIRIDNARLSRELK